MVFRRYTRADGFLRRVGRRYDSLPASVVQMRFERIDPTRAGWRSLRSGNGVAVANFCTVLRARFRCVAMALIVQPLAKSVAYLLVALQALLAVTLLLVGQTLLLDCSDGTVLPGRGGHEGFARSEAPDLGEVGRLVGAEKLPSNTRSRAWPRFLTRCQRSVTCCASGAP